MEFRHSREFQRAQSYFHAAQSRMSSMLCTSGILEAQCFFLSGVYLMATMRPLAAWRMFVQALTCCQVLMSTSEHHDPTSGVGLQQSLYWTCFKSELELRLELNITRNPIFDLTYPSFYPSPPRAIHADKEVVWYYYLAEIALRRLGNRVLTTFHKQKPAIRSAIAASMVQNFENQASNWLASLPPALKLDSSHRNESITHHDTAQLETSLRYILNAHLIDCYEMMYWHFLAHYFDSPPSDTVSPLSPAAPSTPQIETYAAKALQVAIQRIHADSYGFRQRHHGSWLMLRSCSRSALVLLAASRHPSLRKLVPRGWQDAVESVKGLLRFWADECADARARLRIVEELS
jgi:hypothetical protein